MVATRLIAMHVNKGKTLAQCLEARTDYAQNPEKTEKGNLVTAYECDPMTCDEEFLLSKRQYRQFTGRDQRGDVDRLSDSAVLQTRRDHRRGSKPRRL